jgi:nucleoside-diphosphate-sugar epimerase
MQTILGANGVIAKNLAKELTAYTNAIRLVSRNPKQVNPTDKILSANLLSLPETLRAVEGSEIVYLTAGLRYSTRIWEKEWPLLIDNVIAACQKYNAKLVFFDNVYALGRVMGAMTETTPLNPCSRKGEVRAKVEETILNAIKTNGLQAIIARAADFYGPETPNSFVTALVFERILKGQSAQWFISLDKKHSLTYTPDAGKATAILGNTSSAYNQIWHLPTNSAALTGAEFIRFVGDELSLKPKSFALPRWLLRTLGIFIEIIRESNEMLYQYEADYIFDSSKFENKFSFKPMPYSEGVKATIASLRGTPKTA